jgi:hypothetical protein
VADLHEGVLARAGLPSDQVAASDAQFVDVVRRDHAQCDFVHISLCFGVRSGTYDEVGLAQDGLGRVAGCTKSLQVVPAHPTFPLPEIHYADCDRARDLRRSCVAVSMA